MFIGITNSPRDYAWGSTTAIADLLGTQPTGRPEAELWLGSHPGSPARLTDGSGRSLPDVLDERLPYLLKVLAAAEPLSLQAHPTPEQAAAGFARENAEGVPLDAPERNYRDAYHKPELIYALSDPFTALCGFRSVEATRALLEPLADDPRIAGLLAHLVDDASIRSVFEWLIRGGDDVDELVAALVESSAVANDLSWDTVRTLSEAYPGDPAIAISLLINTVELRPGQVLYLPAGNIHAYIQGLGIELMASSDNVLRGGMTPKHIDVPELLNVLDFRPVPVPFLKPEVPEPGIEVFRPDVPDFVLTVVSAVATARGVDVPISGPTIALCTDGDVHIGPAGMARGGSMLIQHEASVHISGSGRVFLASAG